MSLTMLITTVVAYRVTARDWRWGVGAVLLTVALLIIDMAFLGANAFKIADGGWFPLVVAGVVLLLMTTWRKAE